MNHKTSKDKNAKDTDANALRLLEDGSLIYFQFEEDFMEDGLRCIPMIVRFKLDTCGIKLKLREWSKMTFDQRNCLCTFECNDPGEILQYRNFLKQIIYEHTGQEATDIHIDQHPAWMDTGRIPLQLQLEFKKYKWKISLHQWESLTVFKRFVLMKLCKPGHENKNFPMAVKEFGFL